MDVISLLKANVNYRILYDVKGRFGLVKISKDESKYKLCRVKERLMGPKKIPYIVTNDGRTLRFPNPDIKRNDTIKLNLDTNEIVAYYKYKIEAYVMITGGNNIGRIGIISKIEKHPGSYEIVYVKDTLGKEFSTRLGNVFVIGDKKPEVTLLKNHTRFSIIEEREHKTKKKIDEEE
jgi:small subunit ribosomal protein S4e